MAPTKPSATSQTLFTFDDDEPNGRKVRHRSRSEVTFKGGLQSLAHRWFRLTPSYSPVLVSNVLREFGSPDARVLDPFSGRGTTLIECQLAGVPSIGVEINPMLHFAAQVSLDWTVEPKAFSTAFENVTSEASCYRTQYRDCSPEELADVLEVNFPAIHNVYRWWRRDVLHDLLALKGAIRRTCKSDQLRNLMMLALSSILLDAASITLGRLQLHFIDRSRDEINTNSLFKDACDKVRADLEELNPLPSDAASTIYHGDSTRLIEYVGSFSPNLVITSPPYPNRYSYVWNTRPHLYFLDFFSTSKEAAVLDCTTIGGTWGTATSRHAKTEFSYSSQVVETIVGPIVDEIRANDLLMSNYVAMYFDDLHRHILQLESCLPKGAICAYVVGNSRIKRSIVHTDILLGQLFETASFRQLRLEEIRRRNSGKELHETIVFAERL